MAESRGHIVIVDDEVELANVLAETFELENYQVSEFHSAEDALEKINDLDFDVIISDANMGGMNGMDFLRELKTRDLKPFHFFLCTGDLEITEQELKDAGGTGLISKPYNLFDLLDVIADLIKK